jgi:perosamine synthetase
VHVWHQYTIRVVDHDRDAFAEQLSAKGVASGVYYPTPIHRLPSFRLELDLPVTEQAAAQALSLPVFPALTQDELETIVEAVNSTAKAGS